MEKVDSRTVTALMTSKDESKPDPESVEQCNKCSKDCKLKNQRGLCMTSTPKKSKWEN